MHADHGDIVTERHEGLARQKLETSSADALRCAPPGSAQGHRNRTERNRLNVPLSLSITSDLESIEDEWRRFEEHADCTPFQTFDWLSAWQRSIGNRAG